MAMLRWAKVNRIKKNSGMTLVEIVFTLLILAIIAVPLGKVFEGAFTFQSRNQRISHANEVSQFVLETFKNGQATELIDGSETTTLL